MNFSDIIKRLEKIFKVITAAAIGLSIIEALIVLFIGIASSNIASTDTALNRIWTNILISLVVVYVFIIIIKILYNANYPSSITNELKSQKELEELKYEAERQKAISEFVVQAIERLNGQTCELNPSNEIHLCDTGVQAGVRELIEPVVANTYFLLNTLNTQFTLGLYLDHYSSLTSEKTAYTDKGVIIINDTLFPTENGIDKELLQQTNLTNEELEIQTAIRKSLNNYQFVKANFRNQLNELTIICSPMPYACNEDDLLGVFFIISKQLEKTPDDLPTTLTIFNRVISNWVYRYNECINNRLERKRMEIETIHLRANSQATLT